MSNLNNNTTQLEALLAKVNALPEAGGEGGSGASTSSVTIEYNSFFESDLAVYWLTDDGFDHMRPDIGETITLSVINGFLLIYDSMGYSIGYSGGIEGSISIGQNVSAYYVTGDCSITIS